MVTVIMQKKIQKIIKFPAIFGLLLFFLFGLSQFGMGMDMSGKMVNCPFTGHSMSICKMNPLEHIEEWQTMFTTIPVKDAVSVLFQFLVIIGLSMLSFWSRFLIPDIRYLHTRLLSKKRFHISNPLEEAFSQGILNPKLF